MLDPLMTPPKALATRRRQARFKVFIACEDWLTGAFGDILYRLEAGRSFAAP
jgi:hypothetical protein